MPVKAISEKQFTPFSQHGQYKPEKIDRKIIRQGVEIPEKNDADVEKELEAISQEFFKKDIGFEDQYDNCRLGLLTQPFDEKDFFQANILDLLRNPNYQAHNCRFQLLG